MCPRCESARLLWIENRSKYHCRECKYQFRVTAGTVFHDSRLALSKWFVAVSLMLSSERGLPALQLQGILGGSYKTSWFLEHRIRAAMATAPPVIRAPVALAHETPPPRPEQHGVHEQRVEPPPSWGLLRRLIAGSRGKLSTKYLSAYWNELLWREANCANPHAFRDTIVALLEHAPVTYENLIAESPLPLAEPRLP